MAVGGRNWWTIFLIVLFKASCNFLRFHMGRKKHVWEREKDIHNRNIESGKYCTRASSGATNLRLQGKIDEWGKNGGQLPDCSVRFFLSWSTRGGLATVCCGRKIISDYLRAGDWSQADPANLGGESWPESCKAVFAWWTYYNSIHLHG